ncbi:MAG TPA: hypothetical protein VEJ18_18250, partial [Planctomycetota bacterium]|nr:hypothetical protein [Planctomycetota bacterium]
MFALCLAMLAVQEVELFRDDFSKLPIGLLSQPVGQINPAIQEYHYLAHRGVPLEPWANAIVYLDAWAAGEADGKPYLEMHLGPDNARMSPKLFAPCFITGDPVWRDVAVEADVQPLSTDEMAGLVFRYRTNRHHYVFVLQGGACARLAVRQPVEKTFRVCDWKELGEVEFPYDVRRTYRLRVENEGPKIRAFIDGKLVLSAEDDQLPAGKVGLTATTPARFGAFRVTCSASTRSEIEQALAGRRGVERELQSSNPKPVVWKKFRTPLFGAGRNVRFGDLDGDGVVDMLFAQVVAKVDSGNFVEASCLTAVTMEGQVLWQLGRPDPRHGLLTSDTPFQIHDLDGDGRTEVVLVKDFKLQVLDGATGAVKRWAWMPMVPEEYRQKKFELKERPHLLNAGDSISFFDLSGKGRRSEVLIKDRYRFFWVLDASLEEKWQGQGQLGHFPYPFDADGD